MILSPGDFSAVQGPVAMVDGGFDPLHVGHLTYLAEASKLGLPVLCNIQSDVYLTDVKKRPPLLPEAQRLRLLDALRSVSYVHLCVSSTRDVLERLKPAKYVKGADWKLRGLPPEELEVCRKNNIDVVFLDTMLDSSTGLTRKFIEGARIMNSTKEVTVNGFERFIYSQKEVAPDSYDHQYFQGEWRKDENAYSIEKRRAIEAKNPQNIKEVFHPTRVLDVGCGPGALMLFLHELGVEVHGVDISSDAKAQAPVAVRERIRIAPVTEFLDMGMNFDLVVCREVLEHLTVLQVRQAVGVLARYTDRFLYVTTRFHPLPNGLLDVTNDFGNDPTHITAINKDFLRVLFLLEGLKSRHDLEEKMDWKKLGRVLVFEKNGR
jgi:cytidyltransferase-like protein